MILKIMITMIINTIMGEKIIIMMKMVMIKIEMMNMKLIMKIKINIKLIIKKNNFF